MPALPSTRFSDWTQFGYGSFYKRYVAGLQALAQRRCGCSPEAAEALAHGFVAEQSCHQGGGVLARFDRGRRFRHYVVVVFLNHCRRQLGARAPAPLDDELAAPPHDDPAWNLLAEEAEQLRLRVREAVDEARASLLEGDALAPAERAYLELKWHAAGAPPRSDLEVARRLHAQGLLAAPSEPALVRAAARLGARVGRQLVARLHALLHAVVRQHDPTVADAEAARRARFSLGAIVHVLSLEEAHPAD